MPNIEIKAPCESLESASEIAKSLGARFDGVFQQTDTYFFTREGRLKIRELGDGQAYLIPYMRPNDEGPRKSDYEVIRLEDGAHTIALLSRILGKEVVVKKERSLFMLANTRIHLDQVEKLGSFIEFEAVYTEDSDEESQRRLVDELMDRFRIDPKNLISGSYRELMLARAQN